MPVNRYSFNRIFGINPYTGDIFPLYNTRINEQTYPKFISIPQGLSFGGIDIYQLQSRSFSAHWDPQNEILTIIGII